MKPKNPLKLKEEAVRAPLTQGTVESADRYRKARWTAASVVIEANEEEEKGGRGGHEDRVLFGLRKVLPNQQTTKEGDSDSCRGCSQGESRTAGLGSCWASVTKITLISIPEKAYSKARKETFRFKGGNVHSVLVVEQLVSIAVIHAGGLMGVCLYIRACALWTTSFGESCRE